MARTRSSSPWGHPAGLGYLRLLALAGLELADAKGDLETTTFGLFCFGFLGSRLLRRFFWDIGIPSVAWTGARSICDGNDHRLFSDSVRPNLISRPKRTGLRG